MKPLPSRSTTACFALARILGLMAGYCCSGAFAANFYRDYQYDQGVGDRYEELLNAISNYDDQEDAAKMSTRDQIQIHELSSAFSLNKNFYINYHYNQGVGGRYDTLFTPTNNYERPKEEEEEKKWKIDLIQSEEFMTGLQALKDIVQKAADDNMRVRAYGARWSVTDVPYTQDYMIDTRGLYYAKIGIEDNNFITTKYQGELKGRLAFVQSGVRLKYLYRALFSEGLTLSTSPCTDGQTIGGAISTGSHNTAIKFGAMQDFVKGIHLVLLGKTVFLQKSSDPVVTESYMAEIGADELIADDELFYAALVSFGSFGIIHAYLIETEPIFRLVSQVKRQPFAEATDALYSLDIESLGFDITDPSGIPWHFEIFVNPYNLEGLTGTSARVMQKIPLADDEIAQIMDTAESFVPDYGGKDLGLSIGAQYMKASEMGAFPETLDESTADVQRELYGIINELSIFSMLFYGGLYEREGYPLELYGDPVSTLTDYFYLPVSTTAMGPCFPHGDIQTALPLILDVLYDYPSPTALHIRYLQPSNATLAVARFEGINVCIAMNSVSGKQANVANSMVQRALELNRDTISFTYHWGKVLPPNTEWPVLSHGKKAVADWIKQRSKLLRSRQMRYLFSNEYTDALGLTGWRRAVDQ